MADSFHILLVEDSPADVRIIRRALGECNVAHALTVIPDGRKAIDYLERFVGSHEGEMETPDLILLDLNLPGLDGCQVLTHIKTSDDLRQIPVVVLTTSQRDDDILQTYRAGANSYFQKPAEYPRYRDLVDTLQTYWQKSALRPPKGRQRPS
jgi:chemotaxis family two-component system response regulator Rcp1